MDGVCMYVGLSAPCERRLREHWGARKLGATPVQRWLSRLRRFEDLTRTSLCEIPPNLDGLFSLDAIRLEEHCIREVALKLLRTTGLVLLNVQHNPFRPYRDTFAVNEKTVQEAIKFLFHPPQVRLGETVDPYSLCTNRKPIEELACEAMQVSLGVL